jgi:hypothetical protein
MTTMQNNHRKAIPRRTMSRKEMTSSRPGFEFSNAAQAARAKTRADAMLKSGELTKAERDAVWREADKVLKREAEPIEGQSARPRLDRPSRKARRADGGKVEPEMRSYEPTLRDKMARALSGEDRLSPERRRLIEGLTGSSGLGRTGVGIVDLLPPGLLRVIEATEGTDVGAPRKAYAGGGGVTGQSPSLREIEELGPDEAWANARARTRATKVK